MSSSILVPNTIVLLDETTAWAIARHWENDGLFIIDVRFYLDLADRGDSRRQPSLQVAADLVVFMDRESQALSPDDRVRTQTFA